MAYPELSGQILTEITSEHIDGYAAHLRGRKLQVSSVNSRLRVLRRAFRLAVDWNALPAPPKITLLSGEKHRERVIMPDEEQRYLAAATSLLADMATVLFDSGMRPEECFRQRWENITWVTGRFGTIFIACGKTKAARRVLPLTPRVRAILENRWNAANRPEEGWIWPAETISGHVEPSTFKRQHKKALRVSKVRPFVVYSARHTFLTRLGESGCDVWTLARIAGHSSISQSMRYVHPSADKVLDALSIFLGGHNSGHSQESGEQAPDAQQRQVHVLPKV